MRSIGCVVPRDIVMRMGVMGVMGVMCRVAIGLGLFWVGMGRMGVWHVIIVMFV